MGGAAHGGVAGRGGAGQDGAPTRRLAKKQPTRLLSREPVESKTRTYHGRVGSGRAAARRGGVGQDWVLTELFAQETRDPRTFQGIEGNSA